MNVGSRPTSLAVGPTHNTMTETVVEPYALSARSLSQADMPLGFAFRLYDAFSAAVQRKCTCSVLRSLAGMGGLPRRLGWFMGRIMVYTNSSCNPSLTLI